MPCVHEGGQDRTAREARALILSSLKETAVFSPSVFLETQVADFTESPHTEGTTQPDTRPPQLVSLGVALAGSAPGPESITVKPCQEVLLQMGLTDNRALPATQQAMKPTCAMLRPRNTRSLRALAVCSETTKMGNRQTVINQSAQPVELVV